MKLAALRSSLTLAGACCCLSLAAPNAPAAPVDLSDIPLYVLEGVDPNIFLTLDDSGSMTWSYMPNETRWYHDTKRAKSSAFNKLYYNPDVFYAPPVNDFGVSLGNASFTAAWDDGFDRDNCSVDLRTQYRPSWGGSIPHDNCGSDDLLNDQDDTRYGPEFSEDSRGPAFYYLYDGDGDINDDASYKLVPVSDTSGPGGTDERQNFANWYSYYRKRTYATKTAATLAFANLGTALRTAHQTLNKYSLSSLRQFSGTDRADFFNWINKVPASGGTPLRYALYKVGEYLKTAEPYRDDTTDSGSKERSCRQNFHVLMTDGYWNNSKGVSGNIDNQKYTLPDNEYGITGYAPRAPYMDDNTDYLADNAFYYWVNDLRTDLDNDVPTHIIDRDSDIDGNGTVDKHDIFWNPVNDPANWQHLVNYTVGLGVNGVRAFPDDYKELLAGTKNWDDGDEVDDLWHSAINSRGRYFSADSPQELVDSLQSLLKNILDSISSGSSAAINSGFVSSETKLFQVRFDTGDWTGQLISLPISDGSNNSTCTGADPVGDVCAPEWESGCRLTGGSCPFTGTTHSVPNWDTRMVVTLNPDSGKGVPFRWAASTSDTTITEAQKNLLIGSDDAAMGQRRLNYLRGERTNELAKGNPNSVFRNRTSLLGDIINSSPVYVGAPARRYPDTMHPSVPHSSFRTTHAKRTGMVYVGANDGMLHGFEAATGVEKIAYVPNEVFPNLSALTAPAYGHKNYVDGPLTEGDAFFGGSSSWHTLVVGGLGLGGQGIYALDVTDPSKFKETAAADLVLWEYTDRSDVDVGYTFGRPAIRKLNDGTWAVLFGNGFNSTEADGRVSAKGEAVLFLVEAETGKLIKKISVGKGTADDPKGAGRPNGLTDIQPVDRNGDYKVDYVYAGDLFGNVWRFNLTGARDNWKVAFSGQPLYQAKDTKTTAQPITSLTPVGKHPYGMGVMVYFGTGKYLGKGDIQDLNTQTFYGIWDRWFDGDGDTTHNEKNFSPFTRSSLLKQEILGTNLVQFAPKDARVTTDKTINWGSQKGWYLDLTESGERVHQDPILRNDRIIFVTVTPSTDPCLGSGSSWLMELDARDGSRLDVSPFDYSGDGVFSALDDVNFDLDGDGTAEAVPGSGIRLGKGVYTTPAVVKLPKDDQERKYMSTSLGTIESVHESGGMVLKRSWHEIR